MDNINILQIIINYLVPTALGGTIGILTTKLKKTNQTIKDKNKKQEQEHQYLKDGMQALLRNELVRRYREYESLGEMSILDKENVEDMFEQYKNLGGNGTVKHLMDELLALPTKIIKNDKEVK